MAAGSVDRSQSLDELREWRQLLLLNEFKLLKRLITQAVRIFGATNK